VHVLREVAWVEAHSHVDHGLAVRVLGMLSPLRHPSGSPFEVADRCRMLARDLRTAAESYAHAETEATRIGRTFLGVPGLTTFVPGVRLAALPLALAEALGIAATAAIVGRGEGGMAAGMTTLSRSGVAEPMIAGVGAALGNAVPMFPGDYLSGATSIERVAGVVSRLSPRQPMTVTQIGDAAAAPAAGRSVTALTHLIEDAYPATGCSAGSITLQRIDHSDGTRGWVVAIPGTQSGAMGGQTNPMDMQTNLRLMANLPNDSADLVAEGLKQAGAEKGDAVLLAGHSQGGMAAVYLAADKDFSTTYDVKAVLTLGSPVGNKEVPSGTQALHVEHAEEPVAVVDGEPNPDRPNRTVVGRSLAESEDPRDRSAGSQPVGAHDIATYGRTSQMIDAAENDPSIGSWSESAYQVWGEPDDPATAFVFQGSREAR
jgi:hypothetical protein